MTPRSHSSAPRPSRHALSLVAGLALYAGCVGPSPAVPAPPAPARSLDAILAAIASNAARLDKALRSSSVSVTVRYRDEAGAAHVQNLEGSLLFVQPRSLRIDLAPGLGEQVMGLGSDDEEYWVWIEPGLGELRWGRHRNAGRPCTRGLSIRPDRLVAALGLAPLPVDADGLVGPALRPGRAYDILYYLRKRPDGGYFIDREYWIDRSPPFLVRLVLFRDESAQPSASAFLDDYRPAWPDGPFIPHAVSLKSHRSDDHFTLQMSAARPIEPSAIRPGSFRRPEPGRLPPGVRAIIQIDEDCDAPATAPADDSGVD